MLIFHFWRENGRGNLARPQWSGTSKPNQKISQLGGPFGPTAISKSCLRIFHRWTPHLKYRVVNNIWLHPILIYSKSQMQKTSPFSFNKLKVKRQSLWLWLIFFDQVWSNFEQVWILSIFRPIHPARFGPLSCYPLIEHQLIVILIIDQRKKNVSSLWQKMANLIFLTNS